MFFRFIILLRFIFFILIIKLFFLFHALTSISQLPALCSKRIIFTRLFFIFYFIILTGKLCAVKLKLSTNKKE